MFYFKDRSNEDNCKEIGFRFFVVFFLFCFFLLCRANSNLFANSLIMDELISFRSITYFFDIVFAIFSPSFFVLFLFITICINDFLHRINKYIHRDIYFILSYIDTILFRFWCLRNIMKVIKNENSTNKINQLVF